MKSDPRLGGCVRGPTASRAHDCIHRPGSQSQRRGRGAVRRYAGFECCARRCDDCGRRDRRGHQTHDKGLCGLPSAHDYPRRRTVDRVAFVAAIDDPSRIRRSRDIGAYLGLVPRRYQSGEVDYTGGISKCGDGRVRTLLYEAANVMLTRYKGQLKLKDWAFAIAKRSTMRKPVSLWLAAWRSSCTRCCGTEPSSRRLRPSIHQTGDRIELPRGATP